MRLVWLTWSVIRKSAAEELCSGHDVTWHDHCDPQKCAPRLMVPVERRQLLNRQVVYEGMITHELVIEPAQLLLQLVCERAKGTRVTALAVKGDQKIAIDAMHVQKDLLPSGRAAENPYDGYGAQPPTREWR